MEKLKKVGNLIVHFGPLPTSDISPQFKLFLELAKDFMHDTSMEFTHIDTSTYNHEELHMLGLEHLLKERRWHIRVYRRHNPRDYRDLPISVFEKMEYETLRNFIVRSTFVGLQSTDTIKELTDETGMKIFDYAVPVLILFRDR